MLQRPWLVWAVLTALAWGAVATMVALHGWLLLRPAPQTLNALRFTVFPVLAVAALASPVVASAALLMKRWVRPALIVLGAVTVAQLVVVLVEVSAAVRREQQREYQYQEILKG